MAGVSIRAGGSIVQLRDEEIGDAVKVLLDRQMEIRQAWEAEQREAGQVWVAKFWRHHCDYTEDFFSKDDAVSFLIYGQQAGDHAMDNVTCPDGTIIDRASLEEIETDWREGTRI